MLSGPDPGKPVISPTLHSRAGVKTPASVAAPASSIWTTASAPRTVTS